MNFRARACGFVVGAALVSSGCHQLQARQAFKDGNKAYKDENYKKAIEYYEKTVQHEPNMAEAYFYLGSAQQALYRPGKEGEENKQRLTSAVENFKKSIELNPGTTPNQKAVKLNALAALTGIYSEDPYKDFDSAFQYADQLVQQNPNDPKNLFAMANLYERFDKVADAEKMYQRAAELNPSDVKACGALATFYNKPLWEGRSQFDKAVTNLERCAGLAPDDATGWYKVAVFYWDKAYRDPLINDQQKDAYADKGLTNVEKALQIKPDYVDAIIFKGLLLRVKAQTAAGNMRLRAQYLDQAQTLAKRAQELRLQQQREAEQAAATLGAGAAATK